MKIRVLRRVTVDGNRYEPGIIDAQPGDAERLLLEHAGVFERVTDEPRKAAKPAEDKATTMAQDKALAPEEDK
jgi:hypothetical protein